MTPRIVVEDLWQQFRRSRRRRSGLRRQRRDLWALQGISLEIDRGETFGVIGANGSGKTTLLQTLAGVLDPIRGRVSVEGRTAALVDLLAGIERDFTGHENILVSGVLLGMSRAEVRERYDSIVEFSGLTEEMLASPFRTYSAGMGLRLGFAVIINTSPDVLLVDEVLAVGDEAFQARCLAAVDERKAHGASIVLVSHDLELVAAHCDRVAVLDGGKLDHVGTTHDAIERYHALAAAPG